MVGQERHDGRARSPLHLRVLRLPGGVTRRALAGARHALVVTVPSFAAGVVLAALGARTSPAAMPVAVVAALTAAAAISFPVIAVAVFFASLPLGFAPVGPVQLIEVTAVTAVLVVLTSRMLGGRLLSALPGALGWAMALVAVALLSYPDSADREASFRAVLQLVGGLALAAAVAMGTDSIRALRTVVVVMLSAGSILALHAIATAGQQTAFFGGAVVSGRAQGIFAQPNELGMVCAMLLCVAIGASLSATAWPDRLASTIAGVALAAALGLSLSRGAWLGAAGGLVALALLLPAFRRRLLLVGLPLLVAGTALVLHFPDNPQVQVISNRLGSFTSPAANPYDERPAILTEGLRQVQERPFLGQGPGAFPAVSEQLTSTTGVTVAAEHAHNALLTVGAEYGLVAVVFLLGLTTALGLRAGRAVGTALGSGRHHDAALHAGLAAALVVVAVHGLVDYPLRNAVGFLLVWAIAGLVVASERLERRAG